MAAENKKTDKTNDDIEEQIKSWRLWVILFAAALLGSYFLYFAWYLEIPASKTASTWAEFGDFFGGILNPLVAFAAFYWLTQSVKLQKIELAETRKALEKSAEAQDQQAKASEKSVRTAAITALLTSIQNELVNQTRILSNIQKSIPKTREEAKVYLEENIAELQLSRDTIIDLEARRRRYEGELIRLLDI